MAEKIIIDLEAKTDKAIKEIEKVSESITELNQEVVKGNKNTSKSLDSVEKSAGSVSKGIKGFGLALKAAGIGLVISALTSMKEIFSQNQRVVDVFSTGFEAFSIVINQVVSAFINTYDAVAKSSENFNGLSKVLGGLVTLGITPLKLGFFLIKLGIKEAQLAWEESFFGGKDNEKIKELNIGITETRKSLLDTGKDAVNAGKDIYNNFSDAIGEIGNIANVAGENLSKISVKSALEQAKVNIELKNSAEIAAAQQSRLVEQYDRQAEKLRQVRDDERNSLEVRKKANDDLLATLDAQEKAMTSQADLQVAAAQNEFNKNKNIENQIALIDALSNREGVLAQVEGLRSEQQSNDLALSREEIELTNTKLESESKLSIERKRFNAEQIQDELLRLEKLKEVDLLEAEQETLRLQAIVDNANAGTQAKVDAQIALDEFLEQSRQTNITRDAETEKAKEEINKKEVQAAKEKVMAVGNALNQLSQIAGENTAVGKGLAIAAATINTYQGVTDALAAKTVTPFDTALKFINAAAILSNGLKTVRQIASVKVPSVGGGSVGGGSVGGGGSAGGGSTISQPPAFNVVGASGTNQLADAIGGQSQQPVKAYVVSNDVTTAQSMDRNIVSGASI
jgi:hypothetical protein